MVNSRGGSTEGKAMLSCKGELPTVRYNVLPLASSTRNPATSRPSHLAAMIQAPA